MTDKFKMKVTKIGNENDFVTFKTTSTFTETTFEGVTYFKNFNLISQVLQAILVTVLMLMTC